MDFRNRDFCFVRKYGIAVFCISTFKENCVAIILVNIAGYLSCGKCVLLINADPQESALDWSAATQNTPLFSAVGHPRPTIHKETDRIIDGPPGVTNLARSEMMASVYNETLKSCFIKKRRMSNMRSIAS